MTPSLYQINIGTNILISRRALRQVLIYSSLMNRYAWRPNPAMSQKSRRIRPSSLHVVQQKLLRRTSQPLLRLFLLLLSDLHQLVPCWVIFTGDLVERIIRMFFKLFPNLIDLLLPSQTLLILHLLQSSLLILRIRCLKPPLGMSVNFVGGVMCQVKRIESIVDARGIERRGCWEGGERGVYAFGFLLCGFGVPGFGLCWEGSFLFF